MRRCLTVACAFLVAVGADAHAEILRVAPDGSGDFPTIQAAADAAQSGDVILLESGVFRGDGNRDVDASGVDVSIVSESGDPLDVVIDCEADSGDPHRALVLAGRFQISGITIINGYLGVGVGGGAAIQAQAALTIVNCVFAWNRAMAGGAIATGGGESSVVSCTFYGNEAMAEDYGSAIAQDDTGTISLRHCILSRGEGGGAIYSLGGSVELQCCDVHGNEGGDYVGPIAGQLGINGNISEDPLFCASPFIDLRIDAGSPCAPGGDCGLIGALPVGCGATPGAESTWGDIKALFRTK